PSHSHESGGCLRARQALADSTLASIALPEGARRTTRRLQICLLKQVIRTAELRVRLPRHHIDMLEYRAVQQETTVSGVLERELDGIASAHVEELSAALPGFAEAMAWPGD